MMFRATPSCRRSVQPSMLLFCGPRASHGGRSVESDLTADESAPSRRRERLAVLSHHRVGPQLLYLACNLSADQDVLGTCT